jgi:hypothetical protein
VVQAFRPAVTSGCDGCRSHLIEDGEKRIHLR